MRGSWAADLHESPVGMGISTRRAPRHSPLKGNVDSAMISSAIPDATGLERLGEVLDEQATRLSDLTSRRRRRRRRRHGPCPQTGGCSLPIDDLGSRWAEESMMHRCCISLSSASHSG